MDPDPDQPKGMIEPPGLSYGWLCFWLNMFLKNATILNPLLTVNSLLTKQRGLDKQIYYSPYSRFKGKKVVKIFGLKRKKR